MTVSGYAATTYYVSTAGDDNNSGTSPDAPFLTIEKARDVVRTVNGSMSGDIYVYLRGGTYYTANGLAFGISDSGMNGYNVIYKAYNGEIPIISGGTKITGWTLYDSAKNIYKATIDASLDFRQIYVGGQRAIRARIPNLTDSVTFASYYQAISSNPFTVNASEISNWDNLNHVECVWISHWHQKRARIESYSEIGSEATITFKSPEKDDAVLNHSSQNPTYYYFENAYEFLDQEGEWYLDKGTHTLYYKPRAGEVMSSVEVIVPQAENVITLTGTPSIYIHNIIFDGITFECSNWTKPNTNGYLNWQDGLQLTTDGSSIVPGMVQMDYAKSIIFERNVFRNSGAHGLVTVHNTTGNTIVGNVFTDLAGGGIYINAANDSGASRYDIIKYNVVEKPGQVYSDCIGILATRVAHMTIEHNMIRNCPYSGINIGWSWNDSDQGCHDNEVRYNRIYNVMQLHDDGGGIYSLGRMDASNFHHNYVSGIAPSAYNGGYSIVGIYLDNGSCHKTVENNVFDSTTAAFLAVNPPNYHNTFQNNYYNVGVGQIGVWDQIGVWEKGVDPNNIEINNVYVTGQNWPQAAQDIINGAGDQPANPDIDQFVVVSPNGNEIFFIGQKVSILWTTSVSFANACIEYSSDNGGTWNDVATTLNTGSYIWTVPNAVSNNCLVRVSDAANSSFADTSDAGFNVY
jgi:hypothetical protein